MRCIRILDLVARPATRVYAAGATQPIIAPRLLTACATLQLPAAGEFSRCGADAVVREQTTRCEYSMRCIRVAELYSRPATRHYAAGAPQPIVAADARQLGTSQSFSSARLNSSVVWRRAALRVAKGLKCRM
jgi:hypothetical protein